MFTVSVDQKLIEHCKNMVSNHDFGKRFTANGTKEQQLTGIIGQSVVMTFFDKGYVDGSSGFDGGVDLTFANKSIDVKTMGRTTSVKQGYTNNFLKLQEYFKTDIYIFCSYHKTKQVLTVCGWISKEDFTKKRRFYPKGSIRTRFDKTTFTTFADLYEIDNKDLNNVNSVSDLKKQLL
ncbi:hypothetical protein C1T31_01670 [Hanstruepera neustonica]|uniref:Uncharacterized protein n=1 Tax=Hanstruepera neustonica TaxID=1445657 RepID=A0A2K1E3L7_9FLAO|nr:hypothetical protein [Hanstruepera neustonica]PNQ74870.1 hypothetical protein C1T31_01670 [Hanstruepera neustonica]